MKKIICTVFIYGNAVLFCIFTLAWGKQPSEIRVFNILYDLLKRFVEFLYISIMPKYMIPFLFDIVVENIFLQIVFFKEFSIKGYFKAVWVEAMFEYQ